MWKERLWQVFLVAILGLVLTMCSRSGGNNNTSSSDTVNAEGISTVSVSSMPSLKVESLPSMTITMDNSSATPVAVTSFPTVTYGQLICDSCCSNIFSYSNCYCS